MKSKLLIGTLILAVIFSMACSLTAVANNAANPGGKTAGVVNDLWPDVPRMDGMTMEKLDLPLPARLAVDGYMKSNNKYLGSLDFIAYSTPSTFQQIEDFYTVDKMKISGWNNPDNPGCAGSVSIGSDVGGGVCFFARQNPEDNTGAVLALFMAKDSKSARTQLYFIRLELTNLPTPTQ